MSCRKEARTSLIQTRWDQPKLDNNVELHILNGQKPKPLFNAQQIAYESWGLDNQSSSWISEVPLYYEVNKGVASFQFRHM